MSAGVDAERPAGTPPAARRLLPRLFFYALAFLSILVPFLYWQGVWFGKQLSIEEVERRLTDPATGERPLQHALSQLLTHIEAQDPAAAALYPALLRLTSHPAAEIRKTVAWVMGGDRRQEAFRAALRNLVADPDLLVRHQAALALAAHGDPAGRSEVRAMLEDLTVTSPATGRVEDALRPGEPVRAGTLLARLATGAGTKLDVPSPLDGRVESMQVLIGAQLAEGAPLCTISPDKKAVLSALWALMNVGNREDADLVRRYVSGAAHLGDEVRTQAELTLQQIARR